MRRAVLFIAFAATGAAQSLEPVLEAMYNAASLAPPTGVGLGSLQVIRGQNLASGEAAGTSNPLPFELLGTSVTFNGYRAPLLFVSPFQINLQVPTILAQFIEVVVHTKGGSSKPLRLEVGRPGNLGVFTLDGGGCGPAHVYNIAENGDITRNAPDNSARPGGKLRIFTTGVSYAPDIPDGIPTPAPAVETWRGILNLQFGPTLLGGRVFLGRAPGLIGVDQIDILLNGDLP